MESDRLVPPTNRLAAAAPPPAETPAGTPAETPANTPAITPADSSAEARSGAPVDRDRYLRQLQALHGLRDDLGLDEIAFRDLLERVSGSRSARWLTPEQRERAVALLRLHREFEALAEQIEAARDALAQGFAASASEVLPKRVLLDGREMARLRASVEEVLALVRFHHPGATLVGVREIAAPADPAPTPATDPTSDPATDRELVLEFRSAAGPSARDAALPRAA